MSLRHLGNLISLSLQTIQYPRLITTEDRSSGGGGILHHARLHLSKIWYQLEPRDLRASWIAFCHSNSPHSMDKSGSELTRIGGSQVLRAPPLGSYSRVSGIQEVAVFPISALGALVPPRRSNLSDFGLQPGFWVMPKVSICFTWFNKRLIKQVNKAGVVVATTDVPYAKRD